MILWEVASGALHVRSTREGESQQPHLFGSWRWMRCGRPHRKIRVASIRLPMPTLLGVPHEGCSQGLKSLDYCLPGIELCGRKVDCAAYQRRGLLSILSNRPFTDRKENEALGSRDLRRRH